MLQRATSPRSLKNISAGALSNPAIFFDLRNLFDERSFNEGNVKHMRKLNIFWHFCNIIVNNIFGTIDCGIQTLSPAILIGSNTAAAFSTRGAGRTSIHSME